MSVNSVGKWKIIQLGLQKRRGIITMAVSKTWDNGGGIKGQRQRWWCKVMRLYLWYNRDGGYGEMGIWKRKHKIGKR